MNKDGLNVYKENDYENTDETKNGKSRGKLIKIFVIRVCLKKKNVKRRIYYVVLD